MQEALEYTIFENCTQTAHVYWSKISIELLYSSSC